LTGLEAAPDGWNSICLVRRVKRYAGTEASKSC
jgi:hypothetical protein